MPGRELLARSREARRQVSNSPVVVSELEKLKQAMATVQLHLQDLAGEQRANTRELGVMKDSVGGLQQSVTSLQQSVTSLQQSVTSLQGSVKNQEARSIHMEATMTALGGTFASIDQILTELLNDKQRVDAMESSLSALARRVEALEQKAS